MFKTKQKIPYDNFYVFYWYQRTSNTIGTMGGPINYEDDDDSDNDDDNDDDNNDDDDVFSKNVCFVGLW